ncbi:cache domain-containing protein [Candidatus Riflebacteria bacterium]
MEPLKLPELKDNRVSVNTEKIGLWNGNTFLLLKELLFPPFFVVLLVLIFIATYFIFKQDRELLFKKRLQLQKLHLTLVKKQITERITFHQNLILRLAREPIFKDVILEPLNLELIKPMLHRAILRHELLSGAWLFDMDGKKVIGEVKPGYEFLSSLVFANPEKLFSNAITFQNLRPLFDEATLSFHLPIEVLVKDKLYIPRGSLLFTLKLDFLAEIASTLEDEGGGKLTVVDKEGSIIYSSNKILLFSQANILDKYFALRSFLGKSFKKHRVSPTTTAKTSFYQIEMKESAHPSSDIMSTFNEFYSIPQNFGYTWYYENGIQYLLVYKTLKSDWDSSPPPFGLLISSHSPFFENINLYLGLFNIAMGMIAFFGVMYLARLLMVSENL